MDQSIVMKTKRYLFSSLACEDEEIPMSRRQRTPLLCRAYWLAHTVATDLAFVITLIYWTLVHDPSLYTHLS